MNPWVTSLAGSPALRLLERASPAELVAHRARQGGHGLANLFLAREVGALWFINHTNKATNSIDRIEATGSHSFSKHGNPDDLSFPIMLTSGPDNALWFAGSGNHTIGWLQTCEDPPVPPLPPECQAAATIVGSVGNDTLVGTSGNDIICGLAGNDTIEGKAGDDIVYGHSGNDTLWGHNGADTLKGGNGNDTLWVTEGAIFSAAVPRTTA